MALARSRKHTPPIRDPCAELCPVAALDNYLAVSREYGVHVGLVSNGEDDTTLCSPYLFPFLVKDLKSGYPVVIPSRAKRGGSVSSGWEKVPTQQCNAWLKRMLVRLDGSVNTEYTFHGTRVVAALISLAAGRQLQTINKTMNWADGSNQANAYARFLQMQHMCQRLFYGFIGSCERAYAIGFTCPTITVATVILWALDRVCSRVLGWLGPGSPSPNPSHTKSRC
jgi:hypothetical protein